MTDLGDCGTCGVPTLSSSVGPVHADTHNRRSSVNGEHIAHPYTPTHHEEKDAR